MPLRADAHGGGGVGDAGQGLQCGIHLAQLDPAAAQLDLLVAAAEEDQPLRFRADEVTAAVGALPAEGFQWGVLLGVLLGVEVAGQADAADHELAAAAHRHRLTGLVDHGQFPAVQRKADPDRLLAGQQRGAGDDGGLGGAVRVPDLAALGDQALGQLGRAGLAAEDQQPDLTQVVRLPERGQCRHRGDHGDLLFHQPGTEVGAAAHLGAGYGHEAGSVAPGQPHLLAGGVEGHGQSGHDPVAGCDRLLGEEQRGFGVHEGGGAAMADGDALGLAGGAGGEDDPGVVLGAGPRGGRGTGVRVAGGVDARSGAQHGPHPGLAEDQLGALVRVLGVDGHVGGTCGEDGEDGHVQLVGPGRHAYADPVTEPHSGGREGAPTALDLDGQCPVGQPGGAVVQGELVGVLPYGGLEDVDEGTRRGGGPGGQPGGLAGLLVRPLVRLLVRLPVRLTLVEQSEFTTLRCGCHRPSCLVSGKPPGRRAEPGFAQVVPVQRQTALQSSASSRIFRLNPCAWLGRNGIAHRLVCEN